MLVREVLQDGKEDSGPPQSPRTQQTARTRKPRLVTKNASKISASNKCPFKGSDAIPVACDGLYGGQAKCRNPMSTNCNPRIATAPRPARSGTRSTLPAHSGQRLPTNQQAPNVLLQEHAPPRQTQVRQRPFGGPPPCRFCLKSWSSCEEARREDHVKVCLFLP